MSAQEPSRRDRGSRINAFKIRSLPRHANAGNAVAVGSNLLIVGKLLGYKVLRTTQKYANPVDRAMSNVANANAADIFAKMTAGKGSAE